MKASYVLLVVCCLTCTLSPAQPTYLYKTTLIQAAPGKLLELIDFYKSSFALDSANGEPMPFMIRHTQGDKWDLLILLPIESYAEYYKPARIVQRKKTESSEVEKRIRDNISWREDLFVYGPPLEDVRTAFGANSFFHVEMFVALATKREALYKEREMENAYQRAIKRPENFIFVRDQGAAWDLFTIGAFRDLKHYAESVNIAEKDQDAAAREAGFESARHIGPYLRTLIREHHDTLANIVR